MKVPASDKNIVRRKAMEYLARREYGINELGRKLVQRGYNEDIIVGVVGELVQENLVSDFRFIESLLSSLQRRGFGPRRARQELRNKAIEDDQVDEWIDEHDTEWTVVAVRTYEKKYRGNPPTDYNNWSKQARFMQGRGFTSEQIRLVIGEYSS
jgi:regulatory protein